MDIDTLNRLSAVFRSAIERVRKNSGFEYGYLSYAFPNSACDETSVLLAEYLIENGIRGVKYIKGTRRYDDDRGSTYHIWLLVDHIIVDITADQFNNLDDDKFIPPVIVARKSSFHKKYRVLKGDKCSPRIKYYCNSDRQCMEGLWSNYDAIIEEIRNPS